jgi:membrane dipeptidase
VTTTRLFWEQHSCLPLAPEADIEDVLRFRREGGAYVCLNVGYAPHSKQESVGFARQFAADVAAHPELELVGTVAEIDAAHAAGKTVVAFDLECSNPLEGDLGMVKTFYDLGVRSLGTSYNLSNLAGCGCLEKNDTGITAWGKELVHEMNAVGMLVDGSHTSVRTGLGLSEAAGLDGKPMIYSHSGFKARWDHVRNITDEQARECAATGGVIGIPGIGIFLGENTATMDAYVAMIDYGVDLVGWEHIGIGSDYSFDADDLVVDIGENPDLFPEEYTKWGPIGFIEPETTLTVESELVERGYPEEAIRGILGDNFRRVASEVWA